MSAIWAWLFPECITWPTDNQARIEEDPRLRAFAARLVDILASPFRFIRKQWLSLTWAALLRLPNEESQDILETRTTASPWVDDSAEATGEAIRWVTNSPQPYAPAVAEEEQPEVVRPSHRELSGSLN